MQLSGLFEAGVLRAASENLLLPVFAFCFGAPLTSLFLLQVSSLAMPLKKHPTNSVHLSRLKALRKKNSDCEIHGESRAAGNSPGSNYHSPQEIKYTAKSLSVAQTRRSARGLEADKYVRTNSGLLLGRDRDLETQAIATSMKIKGQQAGDKVLFSSKQRAAKMFMSGIFFSSFGQAELGCSRAAQDLIRSQEPNQRVQRWARV